MIYKLLSREQALKCGAKRYYTGKPCGYGHIVDRYTSTGACCECVLISRRNAAKTCTPEQKRAQRRRYKGGVKQYERKPDDVPMEPLDAEWRPLPRKLMAFAPEIKVDPERLRAGR